MTDWFIYSQDVRDPKDIEDASFRLFLDMLWPYVNYFTLTDHLVTDDEDFDELKEGLSPWYAGKTTRDEWFGYGVGSSKMCIYRYRATEETKNVIRSCYRDVLLRMPVHEPQGNHRKFDDLCLFSEGKLFFGSISHEELAYLCPLNRQMLSDVTTIAHWQPCPWRDETDRRDIHGYKWTDE